MKLTLRQQLAQFGHILQDQLFPILEQACGEMDGTSKRLVATLEMLPLARFIPAGGGRVGRPARDRYAMARAFVAKAVYGMTMTRDLIQRLKSEEGLRKLCGWDRAGQIPSESKFSRVFAEFAEMELPQLVHEALIRETQKDRLIGHISRDSTAIEARERYPEEGPKAIRQSKKRADAERKRDRQLSLAGGDGVVEKRKRGAPQGRRGPHKRYPGGKRPYQPNRKSRLHRQRSMKLPQMLQELPRHCSLGVKTSHEGHKKYWRGYKLHLDVADGQIPISAIVTGAALHDSQVAIPLATMTAQRVINLYDVMDAGYDAQEILDHSRSLGHVPIVKAVRRKGKRDGSELQPGRVFTPAEEDRFRERTTVERVHARLKDEFGIREMRVRGYRKIAAQLMFAVLALTADQILKLAV